MIPFNKSYFGGEELRYIAEAHAKGQMAGDDRNEDQFGFNTDDDDKR